MDLTGSRDERAASKNHYSLFVEKIPTHFLLEHLKQQRSLGADCVDVSGRRCVIGARYSLSVSEPTTGRESPICSTNGAVGVVLLNSHRMSLHQRWIVLRAKCRQFFLNGSWVFSESTVKGFSHSGSKLFRSWQKVIKYLVYVSKASFCISDFVSSTKCKAVLFHLSQSRKNVKTHFHCRVTVKKQKQQKM